MIEDEAAAVEERIDLYVTIRSLFRDRPFDEAELGRRLVERGEHGHVSAPGEPDASLSWLVEAAVLGTDTEGFRVIADPDEAAERLAAAGDLPVETVRRRLLSALAAGDKDEEPRTLVRDDDTYAVVELGADEAVETALDRVHTAVTESDYRGVAVTTPGTNANRAQQLADRLVADGPWSKAGSTVAEGDDPDGELVFRLYLDC
ncbi:hypothetical protein ACFR97_07365 [Haloplanus litoreus]|uniref:Uncharacterized protein n=1 Tax=Haloplanus litoreus TaxID=767515 RepID=A0ABD6A1W6_9EURY